tara:strand:- start:190 stop:645 length:456 start_codon:yes stop_codon:yes gene_type:complete
MKNTFFNYTLIIIFLFVGFSVKGQVKIKTNKSDRNKVVVQPNHSNNSSNSVRVKTNKRNYNRGAVRVKKNRNRVVVSKPRRPGIIVKRPNYQRPGYVWVEGYWKWNAFYGHYIWQKARWIKIKRNHYWVPGFWEVAPGGFFWVEGYWELEF